MLEVSKTKTYSSTACSIIIENFNNRTMEIKLHVLLLQGKPFPDQDQNAMDAVMQFAINKLGFAPENILLFGWSIGGYSSLWASTQYPDVKGVVRQILIDLLISD